MTRVGDYEVLGVLGAGGMGRVYKVRNVITDRVEAMKVLLPDLTGRRELADRFLREIKLLAALNHPNIASLHTAFTWNDQLVMVMEYVEGVTLAARIKEGALSPEEAANYIGQVLAALSYAHGLDIIHRDIKPANMMLTPEGVVKLMDFGIARSQNDPILTATGSTMGSLHYMSPEQVRGRDIDERSDLYSVGVSLYELVTGQRPFQAENDYAIMAAQLQNTPAAPSALRPDLPAALNDIILMAMNKDPAQRFQTAEAFRVALQSVGSSAAAAVATPDSVTAIPQAGATRTGVVTPSALAQAAKSGSAEIVSRPATQPSAPLTSAPSVPQAPPAPQPPLASVPPATGHRGLYVSLGAVIVLAAMVVAGIYAPRVWKARAVAVSAVSKAASPAPGSSSPVPAEPNKAEAAGTSPATTTPDDSDGKPRPPSAMSPTSNVAIAEPPAAKPSADVDRANKPSAPAIMRKAGTAQKLAPPQDTRTSEPREERAALNLNAPTPPASAPDVPAVNTVQLQQLEHDLDLLGSRAEAVNSSLDNMRQAQATQGLGMRGDIVAAQQRLQSYLGKAQTALHNQDASGAKKYLDLAESQVALLEKFLGR